MLCNLAYLNKIFSSIVVIAPTGSTITCSTPTGIVLTTTETNGSWIFNNLKNYGTYIITATNGTQTKTRSIFIDVSNIFTVLIDYKLWLYKYGTEFIDTTGGWGISGYTYLNGTLDWPVTECIKNNDSFYNSGSSKSAPLLGTLNTINFNGYTKLKATMKKTMANNLAQPWIAVESSKSLSNGAVASTPKCQSANTIETLTIDISSLTGSYYIVFKHTGGKDNGIGYLYELWLE